MRKLKQKFSIKEIGVFRFYSGLIVGVGFSFVLNSLLRQIFRILQFNKAFVESSSKGILDYNFSIYNLNIIGFTSVSLAFCFITYLWMSKLYSSVRRKTLKLRFAQTNSVWVFGSVLLFLTQMISFVDEAQISVESDYPYLGFMLPVFIFLYCWNLISDVFKSFKPFLISVLIFVVYGLILSKV